MPSANGIFQQIVTTLRGRKILSGSFVTNSTGTPTSQIGDGVVARASVGNFTVTLPKKYGKCESLIADTTASTSGAKVYAAYSPGLGVISIGNTVAGTSTDTTGNTISWIAILSDRTS